MKNTPAPGLNISYSTRTPSPIEGIHHYFNENGGGASRTILYRKGEWIYSPGYPLTGIYEVAAGVVRISHLTEAGEEVTADILTSTDLFGNLKAQPDNTSELAKALVDTCIRFYDLDYFLDRRAIDPVVDAWFNRYIMDRWAFLEKRLVRITTCRPATNVAFLYDLFDRKVEDAHGMRHTLLKLITQKDMADMVGTTRQTVAAVMKERAYEGA